MRGPFLLRPLQVDMSVPAKVGGVYCLGKDSKNIAVIARVDANLREAIKAHWKEYNFFWFQPGLTPRDSYAIHCRQYHKSLSSGQLQDTSHPVPPEKSDFKCPVCGQ